jgi:hypothetical protein
MTLRKKNGRKGSTLHQSHIDGNDNNRVTDRHQTSPPYVSRTETGYERIPRELMGEILPVTAEEKEDLESLAQVALDGDLGSSLFPLLCGPFRKILAVSRPERQKERRPKSSTYANTASTFRLQRYRVC